MQLMQVIAGLALIAFGRKLFWLFVGSIGFFATFGLATRTFPNQPEWLVVLIAASAGLAGAVLAVFVQSLALGITAFLAGGYFLSNMLEGVGLNLGPFGWFVFTSGGLAAGFLVVFLFEWAIVVLSSFSGAALIVQMSGLEPEVTALLFFTLFLAGTGLQVSIQHWEERQRDKD